MNNIDNINNIEIIPINLKEEYFKQFKSIPNNNGYSVLKGLSQHQMEVHFYKHYVNVYVKKTNEYMKKNIKLCNNVIRQLGIKDINNIVLPYIISDNSKFLQLLYKECNDEKARHSIGQIFYHVLFFLGLTSRKKCDECFDIYMKSIFHTKENFGKFYIKLVIK